jgi:hypothetical protein
MDPAFFDGTLADSFSEQLCTSEMKLVIGANHKQGIVRLTTKDVINSVHAPLYPDVLRFSLTVAIASLLRLSVTAFGYIFALP